MVVCKFFLQGNCRFGANCRNEHPSGQSGGGGGGGGGGGFSNQNRFGALSNTGTNQFGGASDNSKPYNLNTSDIRLDLTRGQGRPEWILSTYGAGRGTPASLFEGNEYSMEEIRVRFYEMASKGQEAQADQEAIQLWNKAEQDVDNAARHIDDIVKFMEEAEKKHPNRYDLCKTDGTKSIEEVAKAAEASNSNSNASGFGNSSPFGQAPNNNANPFSKPAAATFGQASTPSAFGGSAFGKPAQPSAFGQPSFGQSAFGASTAAKPSPFGQSSTPSAFGQPAAASAFGKPAFGASAFGQPAFGQAAQATTTSPFGQAAQAPKPSPFGQAAASSGFGASPFGQAAKPNPFAAPAASSGFGAGTSAFGQPAQSSSPFGQAAQSTPAFGQPSQPSTAFGQPTQPSGFGQSGFGQSAQPSAFGQSAFGQPAQPAASSPFGQAKASSPFGAGSIQASPFGQAAQQTASPFSKPEEPRIVEISMDADAPLNPPTQEPVNNPFGMLQAASTTPFAPATVSSAPAPAPTQAPTQQAQSTNNNSSEKPQLPTTKPAQPLHYNQTLPQAANTYNQFKRLDTYRGQRLQWMTKDPAEVPTYRRPDGKGVEKIWFPDAGATQEVVTLNKEDKISDLQEDNDRYTEEITRQFAYLFDEGRFRDGKIPLVPPIREWCAYDF